MFTLTLVTPRKKLLTDVDIEEVIVPAARGQLNILPGHAPLVSTLTAGILRVREAGETTMKSAAISWGYLEVNPTGVVVLAETAEWKEEVDKDRAKQELELANNKMKQAGLSPDDYSLAQRKVAKEQVRIEI